MKIVYSLLFFALISSNLFSQHPVKKVLLEEFSTAPCGFCPEGGIIAEELLHKYPNIYTFTHHAGFGTDSMTIPESKTIAAKYTTFAPAAVIDRGNYPIPVFTKEGFIGVSRQKWDSVVAVRLNDPAEVIVKIDKINLDEQNRMLSVDVSAQFLLSKSEENDYRVNVLIIEDSVSGVGKGWDQKNYFNNEPKYPDLYHKGDSIVGFQHRHVVRAMPTGAWGLAGIIPSIPESGTTYKYSLENFNLPAIWKIKDLSVLVFVSHFNTDYFKHKIYNTDGESLAGYMKLDVTGQAQANEEEFGIYPNPAGSLTYIRFGFAYPTSAKIELYSAAGEKIRNIAETGIYTDNPVYFYTSDLAQGVYFVKVTYSGGIIARSFVVL
jgi:hypothetical protein